MSLTNRVNPFGDIVALPARGTLMGNRGCLHNESRRVVRPWQRKAWVTCALSFNGRRREVMAPNRYTELFFLDEATALAAGHRPCRTCRRAEFDRFKELWVQSNPELAARAGDAMVDIDKLLHEERVDAPRRKRTWTAEVGALPDGVMMVLPGSGRPLLKHGSALFVWSPGGYEATPLVIDSSQGVEVLTPPSVVNVIRAGYRPSIHPSLSSR